MPKKQSATPAKPPARARRSKQHPNSEFQEVLLSRQNCANQSYLEDAGVPEGGGAARDKSGVRELENGRRQRCGHHGRELRQRGRAFRLAAALFGRRARGQSAVITAAVAEQITGEVFFPRGAASSFGPSPLLFAPKSLLRARTLALSRCHGSVRDHPANARLLTESAAAAAPPLRRRRTPPPVTSRVRYNSPFSFLDGAHTRAREVGGGRWR